jgi:two-component system LytT family response regulator
VSSTPPLASEAPRIRTLIADDEPLARERMRYLLSPSSDIDIVGEARDGDEAADMVDSLKPDLLLLDIDMPGRTGVSLARSLADRADPAIVFVTAHYQFAVEGFEMDAVDYLLKPVSDERLAMALARVRRRRQPADAAPAKVVQAPLTPSTGEYATALWVQKRQGLVQVDIKDIEWIEAAGDYVVLHTLAQAHMLRATMDGLAGQMDPAVMLRVSRSAFVNRPHIQRVHRIGRGAMVLVLDSGAAVRVGVTFRDMISRLLES